MVVRQATGKLHICESPCFFVIKDRGRWDWAQLSDRLVFCIIITEWVDRHQM